MPHLIQRCLMYCEAARIYCFVVLWRCLELGSRHKMRWACVKQRILSWLVVKSKHHLNLRDLLLHAWSSCEIAYVFSEGTILSMAIHNQELTILLTQPRTLKVFNVLSPPEDLQRCTVLLSVMSLSTKASCSRPVGSKTFTMSVFLICDRNTRCLLTHRLLRGSMALPHVLQVVIAIIREA